MADEPASPSLGFPGGPSIPPYGENRPQAPPPQPPPPRGNPYPQPPEPSPSWWTSKRLFAVIGGAAALLLLTVSVTIINKGEENATPEPPGPEPSNTTVAPVPVGTNCQSTVRSAEDPFGSPTTAELAGLPASGTGQIGALLWAVRAGTDNPHVLSATDGVVAISDSDLRTRPQGGSVVVGRDAATGEQRWSVAVVVAEESFAEPAIGNGSLLIPAPGDDDSDAVAVLDLASGEVRDCLTGPDGIAQLWGGGGQVYATSFGGGLDQLGPDAVRWSYPQDVTTILGGNEQILVVGVGNGTNDVYPVSIAGLDVTTGAELWRKTLAELTAGSGSLDGSPVAGPLDAGGNIISRGTFTTDPQYAATTDAGIAFTVVPWTGGGIPDDIESMWFMHVGFDGTPLQVGSLWGSYGPIHRAGSDAAWVLPTTEADQSVPLQRPAYVRVSPGELQDLNAEAQNYTLRAAVDGTRFVTVAARPSDPFTSRVWLFEQNQLIGELDAFANTMVLGPGLFVGNGIANAQRGVLADYIFAYSLNPSEAGAGGGSGGAGSSSAPVPSPAPAPASGGGGNNA